MMFYPKELELILLVLLVCLYKFSYLLLPIHHTPFKEVFYCNFQVILDEILLNLLFYLKIALLLLFNHNLNLDVYIKKLLEEHMSQKVHGVSGYNVYMI